MKENLYLLWIPNGGWGVFGYGCPDTGAFPNWMYRKYTISSEQYDKFFKKLMGVKERLVIDNVVPTKGREKEIFPELSDLLSD